MLFHYDGRASEWEEFEWSKRAIHVSIRKQTKWLAANFLSRNSHIPPSRSFYVLTDLLKKSMNFPRRWYAKRFLHPDIVAPYEYIFIWDEDLGVEHFDSEKYVSEALTSF